MDDFEIKESSPLKSVLKFVVPIIVLLLVLVLAYFIMKGGNKGGMPGAGGWGGAPGGNVTTVRTIVAENTTMKDFVNTNGEVQTQTSIEVFPSIGGKVVQMNVSLGSQVRKGQIIAYIDPSEPGSYYANSPVTAPISGSILSTPVKTGQKVNASTVITKIGDIENLQITAKIPEKYIAELKIGLKAEIRLEAYNDSVFMATVTRISPVVDAATRTKEIILTFDQKDSRINAGMFANVKLFTTEYKDVISIQQDAFVNNNDKYYLYVVNPDGETVTKRLVTLGKNIDGYYQVVDGVSVGESVVIEGTLTLAEGSKIKEVNKSSAKTEEQTAPSDSTLAN